MRKIVIDQYSQNQRLDKFIMRYLNNAPKHFIYRMIRKKNIKVNNNSTSASYILQAGDTVTIYISENSITNFIENKEIKYHDSPAIIYQDKNIIILNKPVGLLTQPNKLDSDSLIDRLRYYISKKDNIIQSNFLPIAVSRLDRNTAGLVLCALNLPSAQILSSLVQKRLVDKYYKATVHGNFSKKMILEDYHKILPNNIVKIYKKPTDGAKHISTEVEPIMFHVEHNRTDVKVKLLTGRKHQIRAHLAYIGHPIVGDFKYGKADNEKHQSLIAYKIVFTESYGILEYLKGKEFSLWDGY